MVVGSFAPMFQNALDKYDALQSLWFKTALPVNCSSNYRYASFHSLVLYLKRRICQLIFTTMNVAETFGDVATMLAQMAPEKIVNLKASTTMSEEVERLIELKKEGTISLEQATELERYLALDLFISLTKARARLLLAK